MSLNNYEIFNVFDGQQALAMIESNQYDLYIIDINIPHIDGLDLVKFIRGIYINIPIMIITASLEIKNLLTAFDYGCNEYMKKPFHLKELEVRINKLLQNRKGVTVLCNDLEYDEQNKELYYKNDTIKLRKKEKLLLHILVINKGKNVPYDVISSFVWENQQKEQYPIRQLTNDLRKKLPADMIKTEVGHGLSLSC